MAFCIHRLQNQLRVVIIPWIISCLRMICSPPVIPRVQDGAVPTALMALGTAGVALSCPEFGTLAAACPLSLCPRSCHGLDEEESQHL